MDLAVWLHDGRLRGLCELIDQLPRGARLWTAMADDDELADELVMVAEQNGDDQDPAHWRPPLDEWGLVPLMLRELIHETRILRNVSLAAAGGKPKHQPAFPAPETARERAENRLNAKVAEETASLFGF